MYNVFIMYMKHITSIMYMVYMKYNNTEKELFMPKKAVISFVIEKGGTGKSTCAFCCAGELAKRHKVLLIDLDGQAANLSYFCGVDKADIKTILDILNDDAALEDAVLNVSGKMDIIPADNSIMDIGTQAHFDYLSEKYDFSSGADYQLHLIEKMQELVKSALEKYDYVIMDPNPSPNYLHTLSLCCTQHVIIPVLPDAASIISDEGTAESIRIIKETGINDDINVLGILFNRYTNRTNLGKQVTEIIKEYAKDMNTSVFKSTIRNSVVLSECTGMHTPITDYRPKSPAADDVRAVVREIKRRINNGNKA